MSLVANGSLVGLCADLQGQVSTPQNPPHNAPLFRDSRLDPEPKLPRRGHLQVRAEARWQREGAGLLALLGKDSGSGEQERLVPGVLTPATLNSHLPKESERRYPQPLPPALSLGPMQLGRWNRQNLPAGACLDMGHLH